MAKARIKFIPLEFEMVLADTDFQAMNAEQRGVYLSLILYMYANGGKCLLDMQHISRITGCRNIDKAWQKIKKKFQIKEDHITHKRVRRELRRAKMLLQTRKKSGLKGAKGRWQSHSTPNGKAMANENVNNNKNANENTNEKRNEIEEEENNISNSNTNTKLRASDSPISFRVRALRFHEALVALIRPRNQSDRTSFRNISNWLAAQCEMGRFTEEIFERAYDYAREARKGRNPAAVFTSLIKKELNYK
jgi:uncharacterized protein YdaU (DUF1376 family)